ncbi:MAG: hypothetical protein Q7R94_02515 [bacterium]|nr:hypothetical protein [bacterium]
MNKYQIKLAIAVAIFLAVSLVVFACATKPQKEIARNIVQSENDWNIFQEVLNGWQIDYPNSATFIGINDDLSPEVIENVIFGKKNSGFWFFGVTVSKTNLKKIEDFVAKPPSHIKFKKYTMVGGLKAAIFEDSSGQDLKYAFLLKKAKLFEIRANNFADYEHIWSSFKFLEPPISSATFQE